MATAQTLSKSIFISHSSKDNQFARRLTTDLEYYGIRAWLDEADLLLGDRLNANIEDAIAQCDYFGIILSSHSVNSDWVRKEFSMATAKEREKGRRLIIPILLEKDAIPADLREEIMGRVYADFTSQDAYAWTFQRLLKQLGHQVPIKDRLRILEDGLAVGWQNASWGYEFFDDKATDCVRSGDYSVRVRLKGFGGLAFAFRPGLATQGYRNLEFYTNGGDRGGQELKVYVNDRPGNGVRTPVMLEPLAPRNWKLTRIPLKQLDAENIVIVKINISNVLRESTADFYLDDLSLVV